MNITLNPYLNFNSQTKKAMEFYHSVLGGKLTMQTFGETGMSQSPEEKDLIIHARLDFDGMTIMASDGGKDHPIDMGNNIHMSLVGTDEKKLTEWFNKLAEGGKVDMTLQKQFWGDIYGQLTDKFDVHWMVNIGSAKPPQK